jgi:hypothetical protein
MLLFPRITESLGKGPMRCRERLDGLLRYYHHGGRLKGQPAMRRMHRTSNYQRGLQGNSPDQTRRFLRSVIASLRLSMPRVEWEAIMRSIAVGILVLSALTIVPLGAHAQSDDRSLRDLLQAPVGHRQPTVQDAQEIRENSSADQAMRKIDEDLKKKLQGICRGC